MLGIMLISATFWQMLRTNKQARSNPMPNDIYTALNPSAWELADLLFNTKTGELWAGLGYIFRGVAALFSGLFWYLKRAMAEKDPRRFSHYIVPDYWLPDYEVKPMRESVADFEVSGGGFPVGFDGQIIRGEPETRADAFARKEAAIAVEITPEEQRVLTNYTPPLRNITLAKQVKAYLQQGKSDYEIAVLCGYAQATVKHYRLCFERALNEDKPLPSSLVGEG